MKIINLKDFASKLFNKQTTYTSLFHHTTYDLLRSNSVFDSAYNSGLIDENSEVFWVENMSPEQEKDKTMYLVFDTIFYVKEYLERYIETRHPLAKIVDTKSTYKILELRKPDPALEEIAQAISEELGKIDQQRDFKTAYDELIFSPFFFFKELACNDIGFLPSVGIEGPMRQLLKAQDELESLFDESDKYSDEPEKFQKLLKEKQKAVTISNQAVKEAMENRKAELLEELWGTAKRDAGRARRLEKRKKEIKKELGYELRDLIPLIIRADDDEFNHFEAGLIMTVRRKNQDRNKPERIANSNLSFALGTTYDDAPRYTRLSSPTDKYPTRGRIPFINAKNEVFCPSFKELAVLSAISDLWQEGEDITCFYDTDIPKRLKKNGRVKPRELQEANRIIQKYRHADCGLDLSKTYKESTYYLNPDNQTDLAIFEDSSKGYQVSPQKIKVTKVFQRVLEIDNYAEIETEHGTVKAYWLEKRPFIRDIDEALNQFITLPIEDAHKLREGLSLDEDTPWDLIPLFLRFLNYRDRKEWVLSYQDLFGKDGLNYPKDAYMGSFNVKKKRWRDIEKIGRNFEKAGLMRVITDHTTDTIILFPLPKALPEKSTDNTRKLREPRRIDLASIKRFKDSGKSTFNLFLGEEDLHHLSELALIPLGEPKKLSKGSKTLEVKCKLDQEKLKQIKF